MPDKVQPHIEMPPSFAEEWPDADALSTECVLNLWVAAQRLEAVSEASVRAAGIPSLAAFNVLTVLEGAGEPLTPSVIAERVFVTRGAMTGVIRSLERRRLVRVEPDRADRRRRLVHLAPGTAARLRRHLGRLHRAERRLMAALDREQRDALVGMLAVLQRELTRLRI